MRITVEFPVRLRVIGVPDEAQLQELGARVRILVAARLAEADEELRRRHGVHRGGDSELHEPYEEGRNEGDRYVIPSYDRHGQDTVIPLRASPGRRTASRPWIVLRSVQFQTLVGRYLLYVASVDERPQVDDAPLYADVELETRWVGVWWVQLNRDYGLGQLAQELTQRAGELSRVGDHRQLAWSITPFDHHRERLAALDDEGRVRSEIPPLGEHNAHRLQAAPVSDDDADNGAGGVMVSHGGWVLYTFMVLPKVELADVLTLGPSARLDLPLRDAEFLVDAAAFRAATGITWQRYAAEFPDEPVPVWAQAASVRRRLPQAAAFLLLDRAASARVDTGGRPGTSGVQAAPSLFLLTSARLARFPPPVRGTMDGWSDDATRRADAPPQGHLEAGQRIAYVVGWIPVDPDRTSQAGYGPTARLLAGRIVDLLSGDPRDQSWRVAMGNVFWHASTPLTQRPPGGTLFEYVLAELERRGQLSAFFAAVDAGDDDLRYRLLLLCLPTRYAGHPLVAPLRRDFTARSLAAGGHTMVEGGDGAGEIWLGGDPARKVKVGEVFGDKDDVYIATKDLQQLKAAKAQELQAALDAEEQALVRDLLAGRLHQEYDGESFARQALARARARVGLTKHDFEKITIEQSMRLRWVILDQSGPLPRYRVVLDFVQRVEGSGAKWQSTGDGVDETADQFGARLIEWETGRAGDFYTGMTIVISAIGLGLVAWEAGLVGALVEAAGGAGVVAGSIGLSELLYIYRLIHGDAKPSLRGFLEAALDGYLMALTFHWAGGLGGWGAGLIGEETATRFVVGWFTKAIVVGSVGGATSAVLERFAHESISAALGEGTLSGIDDYLRTAGLGALTGVLMEFTLAPVMRAALARAGNSIRSVADLAALAHQEGWGPAEWTAAVTDGLSGFRAALARAVPDAAAGRWARILGERLAEVSRELGANALTRRLELSGARFTPAGREGLARYLAASGAMSDQRAVAVAGALGRNPAEAVHFFEALSVLDAAVARHLAAGTFASEAELADFLGRLAPYTAAEQRAVLRLLGELGIEARAPAATGADVLPRQFAAGLRIQAEALEAQAQQLQGQAAKQLRRVASAVGNPTRSGRITADADRLAQDAAALRERARLLREEAGAPSRQPQLPPVAPLPPGAARRIVYLDTNVIDQVARGNADAAQTLLRLRAAGADLRIGHTTWRELVANPGRLETRVHQRLLLEDLGVAVDDEIPRATRLDEYMGSVPLRGNSGFAYEDSQVAIGARAGQGELWSFDAAFAGNPANARARFGLAVAAESQLPQVGGPQDFARARQLLGLDPVEIQADGSVVRGRERLALPSAEEAEAALSGIEAGTPPPGAGAVWIRVPASAAHDAEAVAARVRPLFRSRTGNRVVFRVEGGTDATARSHEMLRVDPGGNVTILRAGRALNLNFGVFERAAEFLIAHRRGARLVVFEVEEGWFQALRSSATPEQGQPAVTGAPGISAVTGVPRTVDIRFGQDQVQIPDSLQAELQEFIVPGSGRVLEFTP